MKEPETARFQTTRWTIVAGLHSSDEALRRRSLNRLVSCYWPPVYAWLRRDGRDQAQAADLTQGFFCDVVLSRSLLDSADRERGRLRTLILTSLKRYSIDQYRRDKVRGRDEVVSLAGVDHEEMLVADATTVSPDELFERRWALAVFESAANRCRRHFEETGKGAHWAVFDLRVLRPATGMTQAPPVEEVARQMGWKSGATVSATVQTVKKRFLAILKQTVAETADGAEHIDDEFQRVIATLTDS